MWKTLTTLLLVAAPLGAALPQDSRPALEHYNLGKSSLAIDGYDPVAYFAEGGGKPKKGNKKITATHQGVTYRFASKKHRDLFLDAPERYEPAYGGWCAWAMSDDANKVEPSPKSYLIEEGQLLLFYDGLFANTKKSWKKAGGAKQRPKADRNWTKVSGEEPQRELLHWNLNQGLALDGFDPTAYRAGDAKRGDLTHAATHDGVTYRFANDQARNAFLADPASFEPQYGGWCAKAMAAGQKIQADPRYFVLEGDDLLVFYNAAARDAWKANAQRQQADNAWAGFLAARG